MEVEVPDDVLLDNLITCCPKGEVHIDNLLGSVGLYSMARILYSWFHSTCKEICQKDGIIG
jgi:hypothetical protein